MRLRGEVITPGGSLKSGRAERYCQHMGDQHDHGPQRDLPPGMAEQLDLPYAGMVSFGHRPFLTEVEQLESWRPDVAIVGAPFDMATTNRPGARFGPRAIRATAYEPGTYHLDLRAGDLRLAGGRRLRRRVLPARPDRGLAHATSASASMRWRRAASFPSSSAVTTRSPGPPQRRSPTCTATATSASCTSTRTPTPRTSSTGNLASHGTPMRRLIESGAVPGTHFVQVGLRGYWPPQDTFEWMLEQGMTWHTMQEIWDRGFKEVMRDAVSEALAKADKLYVSVDIDVLDPAHAPGTGTPEPGGITSADLLGMVRQLCYEHDVAGVDVVEVSPAYDHAELTVNAAHRVVLEALAGMAARRRDAADQPHAAGPSRSWTCLIGSASTCRSARPEWAVGWRVRNSRPPWPPPEVWHTRPRTSR